MINLTNDIKSAMALGSRDHLRTANLLALLASHFDGIVDWEQSDEEWGRVLVGQQMLAIVADRFPLVIVVESELPPAVEDQAHVVRVQDMDGKDYQVDRSILEAAFGRPMTSNVNYDLMSIDELWWATAT